MQGNWINMFAINYAKKLFWLVGLVMSACHVSPVENLTKALPPPIPGSTVTTLVAEASPTQSSLHPTFSSILPRLKAQTKLPIHLPTYIPESDGSNPVYALLESATASEYQIMLAFTENCTGGTACRLGHISATANVAKAPAPTGETVSLAEGLTGYFTDATCGANCSDSTLVWEQNNVRYTVAIKAGKVSTLIKMANSAIAPGPISRLARHPTS